MLVLSRLIDATPPLPQSVLQLNALRSNPNRSLAMVAKIVESDPVLSAKILGLVNSSYYHPKNAINSMTHACSFLGETQIFSMALLVGFHSHFKFNLDAYDLDEKHFLHNTLMQTRLMNAWLKRVGTRYADTLRLATFISDIGKVLINKMLEESGKKELFQIKLRSGVSERTAELELVGATTLEVTAMMLRHWQLPEEIVSLVEYTAKPHGIPDSMKAAVNMMESVHHLWQFWKESKDKISQEALLGFAVFDPKIMPLYEEAVNEVLQYQSA